MPFWLATMMSPSLDGVSTSSFNSCVLIEKGCMSARGFLAWIPAGSGAGETFPRKSTTPA